MKYRLDNITYMTLYDKETMQPIWCDDYSSIENVTLDFDGEDVTFYGKPDIGSPVYIEGTVNEKNEIRIEGIYGGLVND